VQPGRSGPRGHRRRRVRLRHAYDPGVRRTSLAGLALVAFLSAGLLVPVAGTGARVQRDISAYQGLGTWIDIYDLAVIARPIATARAISARGVRTVYVETSNYRQELDVVDAPGVGRLIEALHDSGLEVVSWYLPGFEKPALDLRRSLAAIRFRTPRGDGFDGFALDIEAAVVKPAPRAQRLLTLSRRLRSVVGAGALGAIVPSPRGMELRPTYWPGFPWAALRRLYDVFLPMTYYTYRFDGADAAYGYLARSLAIIRRQTGDPAVPIHLIGGLAEATDATEAEALAQVVGDDGGLAGWSLYDWATTNAPAWQELALVGAR
jgi:hypothetical protein